MAYEPDRVVGGEPRALAGEVILADRPCVKCEYNLRGLEVGGRCPECGTIIRAAGKTKTYADSLVDATASYVRTVLVGLLLLSGVSMGSIAFVVYERVAAAGVRPLGPGYVGAIGLLVGLAWTGGVFLVTWERTKSERIAKDPILDSKAMRLAARGFAVGPGVAGLVFCIAMMVVASARNAAANAGMPMPAAPASFGWMIAVTGLFAFVGLVGFVPLSVYLSALADWAGDTGIGNRLRGAAWAICVCGSLTIVLSVLIAILRGNSSLLPLVLIFTSLVTVAGFVFLFVSQLQLLQCCAWALQNQVVAAERAQRMAERKARERDRVTGAERTRPLDAGEDWEAPGGWGDAGVESGAAEDAGYLCAACGYSLAGLGEEGICPECGQAYVGAQSDVYRPPPVREVDDTPIPLAGGEGGSSGETGGDDGLGLLDEPVEKPRITHRASYITKGRTKPSDGGGGGVSGGGSVGI